MAGVPKSTWNLQRLRELLPKLRKKSGDPPGGSSVLPLAEVPPSKSEGSRLPTLELCWKQTVVAVKPASIALRSKAQASAPTNGPVRLVNMLKDM